MEPRNGGQPQPKKERPMLLRCVAVVLVFVVAAAGLGWRLSVLQIDEASQWEALASRQQLASITVPALRGNIYDVNGKLLAQSANVWTVVASPDVLNRSRLSDAAGDEEDAARLASRELARILELDEEVLYENLSNKEKQYYKIKGKVEKPLADAVQEMRKTYNISGLALRDDTKRYYPYDTLASTVLGFVGDDNNGLEGVERWYEEQLAGTPGRSMVVKDALGNEISAGGEGSYYAPENGYSIALTIDVDIQRSVEKHLEDAVVANNARQRGFCIAMDVNTGAILALAVYPSYNPNDPYTIADPVTNALLEMTPLGSEMYSTLQGQARTLQWRNKALADTYEPGSVFKIITAAAALDSGRYHEDDCFSCGGSIMLDGWDKPISCAGDPPTNHGTPSLRQALIDSCNLSFIQMSAGMGKSVWYDYLRAFGFTEPTGIDLPGEPQQAAINNLVYSEERMGRIELASCSFGQSNKYTAVQMISAVSAAVNGGNLMQPYIVDRVYDPAGNVVQQNSPTVKRQVISPEVSAQICDILEELVSTPNSSGQHAYLAGYQVGGKSGTSEKLDVMAQTGREDAFVSSFLGFAPADNPQVAVLLALDEPEDNSGRSNYFGGRMAGPYVSRIINDTMGILGVPANYQTDAEKARSTVTTPGVVGADLASAQNSMVRAGLTYRIVGTGQTVIGQMPTAYSQVPYGGEVVLYTDASIPQQTAQMPDVTGMSAQAATDTLRALGLNVFREGAPDESTTVKVGTQSAEAGSTVPLGTVVTLVMVDNSNVNYH